MTSTENIEPALGFRTRRLETFDLLIVFVEGQRAGDVLFGRSLLESEQKVHDFPHLGQLRDPLSELLDIRLQTLDGRLLGIPGVPPELADRLQQLPGHQVGQIGRPELADAGDGEASGSSQADVPAEEAQVLSAEVQPVDGLVRQQKPLSVLPLLTLLLQRLHPQTHHLQQLQVFAEAQLCF